MPAGEIHVGDIGTQFRLTVKDQDSNALDVSSATTKQIMFQRPDATTFVNNMGFLNTGIDGVLTYTTVSGDLNLPGTWAFQGYISLPSGTWYSDITRFTVYENLYIGSP